MPEVNLDADELRKLVRGTIFAELFDALVLDCCGKKKTVSECTLNDFKAWAANVVASAYNEHQARIGGKPPKTFSIIHRKKMPKVERLKK